MVQVAFLTLFLGLTSGMQPVAVEVRGPVSAVELMLDGTAVVRLGGPPWRTKVDLGSALEPHELVARALDGKGQEIGRARQILNLPRPPAEVEILLERGARGRPAGAHLTWRSLSGEKPVAVRLLLDGRPLALDERAHAVLPDIAPEVTHILSTEVRFSATIVARKDVGFGGPWGTEVSTELTAVPVRLRAGKKLPEAKDLQGWILAAGKPMPVAAVEHAPAQLVVVRDRAARRMLARFGETMSLDFPRPWIGDLRGFAMTLEREDQIRFVWPAARQASGLGLTSELFDSSGDFTAKDGSVLWLLQTIRPQRNKNEANQRLADAVAVAGLQALVGNRPRAVLLVLSQETQDNSRYSTDAVSRYLEAVRVPLAVWSLGERNRAALGWSGADDISSRNKLQAAFDRLRDNLAAQRMVWIEGGHLPASLSLSPAAAEVVQLVK